MAEASNKKKTTVSPGALDLGKKICHASDTSASTTSEAPQNLLSTPLMVDLSGFPNRSHVARRLLLPKVEGKRYFSLHQ